MSGNRTAAGVRPSLAFLMSAVAHATLVAALWAGSSYMTAPSLAGDLSVAAETGWLQLKGEARDRPFGRNLFTEILSAPDGVTVRLISPAGGEAVGLAWWSPSRGMWLAVDRLMPAKPGARFDCWQRLGGGRRSFVGTIEIDETGSGRILAVPASAVSVAPGTSVALEVSAAADLWSLTWPSVVMEGSAPFRGPS